MLIYIYKQQTTENKMFKVEIENQDKKTIITFTAETLEEAKAIAEDQITKALENLVFVETATAYIWNLTLGGIDVVLD